MTASDETHSRAGPAAFVSSARAVAPSSPAPSPTATARPRPSQTPRAPRGAPYTIAMTDLRVRRRPRHAPAVGAGDLVAAGHSAGDTPCGAGRFQHPAGRQGD